MIIIKIEGLAACMRALRAPGAQVETGQVPDPDHGELSILSG
ncbi:MAG: hypothetical protein OIN90_18170 [Candidatus Methanoperedens sp.]|nr:hypothetical protein [Candidatus Methanoperedens sp.]